MGLSHKYPNQNDQPNWDIQHFEQTRNKGEQSKTEYKQSTKEWNKTNQSDSHVSYYNPCA